MSDPSDVPCTHSWCNLSCIRFIMTPNLSISHNGWPFKNFSEPQSQGLWFLGFWNAGAGLAAGRFLPTRWLDDIWWFDDLMMMMMMMMMMMLYGELMTTQLSNRRKAHSQELFVLNPGYGSWLCLANWNESLKKRKKTWMTMITKSSVPTLIRNSTKK